jgi:3-oxoadipate enol-lactonase
VSAEPRTTEAGELLVRNVVDGHGPPLVLVMGLGVDHRAWLPHIELLRGEHTCVAFDQRGVGETRTLAGERPRPPFSTAGFADDTAALVRELELGPVHVCGVSMGGAIAMELALRHPELVASLALHSTWHRADALLRAVFELRGPILDGLGPRALQRYVALWAWSPAAWERGAGGDPAAATEELISRDPGADWSAGEREGYLGHLRAAIEHDAEARLGEIRARTLISVGDADILTEERFARAMAERIPGARLELVPGGGHAWCFEQPERFCRLQAAFAAG